MKLSKSQRNILTAIANGNFLKAHRDIEGVKTYKLHPLEGDATTVAAEDVQALCDAGLIDSNKKFPAATFWLTIKGEDCITAKR